MLLRLDGMQYFRLFFAVRLEFELTFVVGVFFQSGNNFPGLRMPSGSN